MMPDGSQYQIEVKKHTKKMSKYTFVFVNFIIYMIIGLSMFTNYWQIEWDSALQQCLILYTTVGYGIVSHGVDDIPVYDDPIMLCFLIVYMIYGASIIVFVIDLMMDYVSEYARKKKQQEAHHFDFMAPGNISDFRAKLESSIWDHPLVWVAIDVFNKIGGVFFIIYLDSISDIADQPLGVDTFASKQWSEIFLIVVYFGFVTGSTIGYGLLEPKSEAARVFCFFWTPITIALNIHTFNYYIRLLMSVFFDVVKEEEHNFRIEVVDFLSTHNLFEKLDMDGDGEVDQNEFIIQVLMNACGVELDTVNIIKEFVAVLDTSKDGKISAREFDSRHRIDILHSFLQNRVSVDQITIESNGTE